MLIAEKQSTLLPFKFNKYYYKRHPTSHRMPFIVVIFIISYLQNICQCSKLFQGKSLTSDIQWKSTFRDCLLNLFFGKLQLL